MGLHQGSVHGGQRCGAVVRRMADWRVPGERWLGVDWRLDRADVLIYFDPGPAGRGGGFGGGEAHDAGCAGE
jgi:hypothetical protein